MAEQQAVNHYQVAWEALKTHLEHKAGTLGTGDPNKTAALSVLFLMSTLQPKE